MLHSKQTSQKQTLQSQTLSPPRRLDTKAFTLIELIVVITILAILGTIGFISLQGYSSSSRDTKRTSDLRSLTTAINVKWNTIGLLNTVSSLPANELANPSIGGSNATVGTNYRAGTPNFTVLDQNASNFKDPSTISDYIIGVTTRNGSVFQLSANVEGGGTNAALVTGTFVSRAPTFTFTGALFNLSATATSPSSMTLAGADIAKLRLGDTISISGVTTTPVAPIVITNISPNQLTIGLTSTAYSGTPTLPGIVYTADVAGLIDAFGSFTGAVINGGSLLAYNTSGGSSAVAVVLAPAYSSSTTYTIGQTFSYNGATITVTAPGIGVANTKANPASDTNDIAVWQSGTNNIQVWAATNVGATTTTGYNAALPAANVKWGYYQWGRSDDITSGSFLYFTSYTGVFTSTGGTLSPSNTNFYGTSDWYWNGDTNPVGGWNTANGGNNLWPCAAGYHVPTGGTTDVTTEWGKLYTIVNSASTLGACAQTNVYDRIVCTMKFPFAGLRYSTDGQYYNQGTFGYYWSSSPFSSNAYDAAFWSGAGNVADVNRRASGYSLRCVKD